MLLIKERHNQQEQVAATNLNICSTHHISYNNATNPPNSSPLLICNNNNTNPIDNFHNSNNNRNDDRIIVDNTPSENEEITTIATNCQQLKKKNISSVVDIKSTITVSSTFINNTNCNVLQSNPKHLKRRRKYKKRRNSSMNSNPAQSQMEFHFPIWTFHME